MNFILLLYGRVKPFSMCSDFYSQFFHMCPRHENHINMSPFSVLIYEVALSYKLWKVTGCKRNRGSKKKKGEMSISEGEGKRKTKNGSVVESLLSGVTIIKWRNNTLNK